MGLVVWEQLAGRQFETPPLQAVSLPFTVGVTEQAAYQFRVW